jgi:hypothetical protein
MIMTDMLDDDDELERMFGAARRTGAEPSQDLAARILALAEAEQPVAPRPVAALMPTPVRRSGLSDLLSLIGGWRAAGGLSTVMALGFIIGFAGPLQLSAASAATEQVDLMPGAEMLFADASTRRGNE